MARAHANRAHIHRSKARIEQSARILAWGQRVIRQSERNQIPSERSCLGEVNHETSIAPISLAAILYRHWPLILSSNE